MHNFKLQIEQFFKICVTISPLFVLSMSGWMTYISPLCGLLSIYILTQNHKNILSIPQSITGWFYVIISIFSLPTIAVFLGQLCRNDFSWKYYDSPAHILICMPIFMVLIKSDTKHINHFSYMFPLANFIALVHVLFNPNLHWGLSRLSTFALDPLALGSLGLTFGLISLVSLELHQKKTILIYAIKLSGLIAGLSLSILSGSRTGWLAVPIVLLIWFIYKAPRFKLLALSLSILLSLGFTTMLYMYSPSMHQRIDSVKQEITSYQWNATNPDNSIGARISFARIAIYLFMKKPFEGWGDAGFSEVINDEALNFAEPFTKNTALTAGFHNEITANMVRSGIWGLISSLSLFFIPAYFFIICLNQNSIRVKSIALISITFITCQFISSLTQELLTLKYAASFYGQMLAIFASALFAEKYFYTPKHS